jgi:hypothetical protein
MAEAGDGAVGGGDDRRAPDPNVADLLQKMNMTAEEGNVVEFSDDEEDMDAAVVEWALVGKVLSPSTLHINTIRGAMTRAWGNPYGMKLRSIGERGDNLFVVEFSSKLDMDRVLAGTPWVVGKHAVIMKEYDERLRPSEIRFDQMDIWVSILNLPLGWMNEHRGTCAMKLLGDVRQMDVDEDGKASGALIRARVSVVINKPIKRGVLLKMSKTGDPEWFDAQYEKLPFICFSCGIMGHSEIECANPAPRNEKGKLPYDREVPLRAPDDRRKKFQSFLDAAVESYGSGTSSGARSTRDMSSRYEGRPSSDSKGEHRSPYDSTEAAGKDDGEEVTSPMKMQGVEIRKETGNVGTIAGRQLFPGAGEELKQPMKKRKPKISGPHSSHTPDLNLPAAGQSVIPSGLVSSRVNQIVGDKANNARMSAELTKKQKIMENKLTIGSAAAASDSPLREP